MNQKSKIILGILLIFLLGMVCGSLLTVQVGKRTLLNVSERGTGDISLVLGRMLDRKLDLTKEQEESIASILSDGAAEVEPLRSETKAKLLVLFEKYQPLIEAELTDKQRKKMTGVTKNVRHVLTGGGDEG